jgi:hypothetical protein
LDLRTLEEMRQQLGLELTTNRTDEEPGLFIVTCRVL